MSIDQDEAAGFIEEAVQILEDVASLNDVHQSGLGEVRQAISGWKDTIAQVVSEMENVLRDQPMDIKSKVEEAGDKIRSADSTSRFLDSRRALAGVSVVSDQQETIHPILVQVAQDARTVMDKLEKIDPDLELAHLGCGGVDSAIRSTIEDLGNLKDRLASD